MRRASAATALAFVLAPACGDDPETTFCADVGLISPGVAADERGALDIVIERDGLPAEGWRLVDSGDDRATFDLEDDEPRQYESVSVAKTGPARWEAVGACVGEAGL